MGKENKNGLIKKKKEFFKKKINVVRLPEKRTVGIDIGSKNIKIVAMKGDTILSVATEPIPNGVVSEGNIEAIDLLAKSLRSCKKKIKGGVHKATLCLSGKDIILREIKLPQMKEEQVFDNILNELSNIYLLASGDYITDYRVLELIDDEYTGEASMRVLVVSVPKASVLDYVKVCRKAGIKLERVDVFPNAHTKLIKHLLLEHNGHNEELKVENTESSDRKLLEKIEKKNKKQKDKEKLKKITENYKKESKRQKEKEKQRIADEKERAAKEKKHLEFEAAQKKEAEEARKREQREEALKAAREHAEQHAREAAERERQRALRLAKEKEENERAIKEKLEKQKREQVRAESTGNSFGWYFGQSLDDNEEMDSFSEEMDKETIDFTESLEQEEIAEQTNTFEQAEEVEKVEKAETVEQAEVQEHTETIEPEQTEAPEQAETAEPEEADEINFFDAPLSFAGAYFGQNLYEEDREEDKPAGNTVLDNISEKQPRESFNAEITEEIIDENSPSNAPEGGSETNTETNTSDSETEPNEEESSEDSLNRQFEQLIAETFGKESPYEAYEDSSRTEQSQEYTEQVETEDSSSYGTAPIQTTISDEDASLIFDNLINETLSAKAGENFVQKDEEENTNLLENVCLIDIGFSLSNVTFVKKGSYSMHKVIRYGVEYIREAIAEKLDMDDNSVSTLINSKTDQAMELFYEYYDSIISELDNTMYYYKSINNQKGVDCLIIAGGSSRLPGIKEYFSKQLSVPVFMLSEIADFNYSKSLKRKYMQKEEELHFEDYLSAISITIKEEWI